MTRILLTGTNGQVGHALRPLLEKYGEIVAPQRDRLDLSKTETLLDALNDLKPDLIINPAAYTSVDRAEDEEELAYRVNAEAPAVIAKWSAEHNVSLIHFSTDYVFDGSGDKPWREESQTKPLSVYGASKLAGEQAVQKSGCDNLIVRTSWVYGARGANFLNTILRLARERKELRIVADQFGAPTSAYVIAQAIGTILDHNTFEHGISLRDQGVINVACSGVTNWHAFAVEIVEGLKSRNIELMVETIEPLQSSDYPTKASRPLNSRLDLTRLEKEFGIAPPNWQKALAYELDIITANH